VNDFQTILILSAHTDDGELGCGASIARWADEGKDVHYLALSAAEESVPDSFPRNTLRTEVARATAILGIPGKNLQVLHYPVRRFSEHRQNILDDLITARARIRPDLVLLPSPHDVHQDHRVLSEEGVRAFKNHSILGYELPWNLYRFTNSSYSRVNSLHMERKCRALECYMTQMNRPYFDKEFIYGLARMRGVQIKQPYAECFDVIRWIM